MPARDWKLLLRPQREALPASVRSPVQALNQDTSLNFQILFVCWISSTIRLKIAPKPLQIWSFDPKTSKCESSKA